MSFGGGLDNDDGMVSDINMVPLIDIMLVLLIVFIITVPVLTHTVKLELPRAENARDALEPDTVQLSVTADGAVHWNEEEITEKELEIRLQATALHDPQPEIFVRGDRKVEYEHVVRVMAAVQRAGVLKLGFVTEGKE